MSRHELPGEVDPRIANPDAYYSEKYPDARFEYGGVVRTIAGHLEFERRYREPANMQDPSQFPKRAAIYSQGLMEAGVLDPVDYVPFPEES